MKKTINKAINATNGKKTESVGILMVLFQFFLYIKPDLLDDEMKQAVTMVIASGIIPTYLHRLWRNWKERKKRLPLINKNKL